MISLPASAQSWTPQLLSQGDTPARSGGKGGNSSIGTCIGPAIWPFRFTKMLRSTNVPDGPAYASRCPLNGASARATTHTMSPDPTRSALNPTMLSAVGTQRYRRGDLLERHLVRMCHLLFR